MFTRVFGHIKLMRLYFSIEVLRINETNRTLDSQMKPILINNT